MAIIRYVGYNGTWQENSYLVFLEDLVLNYSYNHFSFSSIISNEGRIDCVDDNRHVSVWRWGGGGIFEKVTRKSLVDSSDSSMSADAAISFYSLFIHHQTHLHLLLPPCHLRQIEE